MKQKNLLKIAMLFVFAMITHFSYGQLVTTIDFETLDSGYTLSDSEGSTFIDVFNRIDRTGDALGGNSSFLFAIEDLNTVSDPSITLDQIDVTGSASFTFSIDMLAHHYNDWDNGDELLITYSVDGGADQNLMWVQSITDPGSAFNEPAALDTNFDGDGECGGSTTLPALTKGTGNLGCVVASSNFATFITNSINLSSNSTLDIKLQFNGFESNDEGLYLDNIIITETAAAASTVTWDGSDSSDWANGANWDSNAVPIVTDNVIIPDVDTAPIIGATTGAVTNDLTITEPNGINITAGGSLIVSGTSTGNVTYNRTLDFVSGNANGWHLISSPVAAQTYNAAYATTNSLANSGTKRGLAFYNDALASGSKYTYLLSDDSNTSSFNTGVYSGSGIGYSAKRASTTGTVAFTGTINTDDVNGVAVSTSGDGFNLLGVPYTSYISSQTFLTDNSNLEQTQIWVWEQGVTGGNFIAMTAKADNFILAPGQGFFVKAASGTAVNFAETNQTANADTFLKSSRTEVKLLINDGESNRFAKVYFLNNVTKGFDSGYEGETFGGIKNSLDLFSQLVEGNQGKKYQVQSLPKSDLESMVIPIGVIADAGKEITFTADAVNLSSGLKVFLEDRQTNIFTRLDEANSEYKITLTETLNGVGRFYMHTTASVLSTEDIILNSVRIFKTDSSTLKITGLPKGKTSFYLYNILGKEMMTTIFTSNGNKEISLSKLASGIYLAKIQTEKGAISKKIILE